MDQLKIVGVDSRGYGKIYKIVMRDPLLPLVSKAIYAYLCSYAGSGTTAFPGREKILRDLSVSKNTYTKYLGALVDAGYITRTRTASGNLYEIRASVPDRDGEQVEAKAKGFGTVPKMAMLDQNLTAQAKALYAYLCSYAGSGAVAYPHRKTIIRELAIGLSAYYVHYNALVDCGYITPVQTTAERGRFGVAEYRLNDSLGIDPLTGLSTPVIGAMSQKSIHGSKTACNTGLCAMSQIPIHGEIEVEGALQAPMSQMPVHGEKVENRVEKTEFSTSPQTAMSQKPMSRESVHGNLRRANNNNNLYKKQILSSRVSEQVTSAQARDVIKFDSSISKSDVKKAIDYDRLEKEIAAWTSLRDTMCHFAGELDRISFQARATLLLKEFVNQLFNIFRRTADTLLVDGRPYPRAQICGALQASMAFEPMNELLFSTIEKQPQIRSLKAYVQKVLLSHAVSALNENNLCFSLEG